MTLQGQWLCLLIRVIHIWQDLTILPVIYRHDLLRKCLQLPAINPKLLYLHHQRNVSEKRGKLTTQQPLANVHHCWIVRIPLVAVVIVVAIVVIAVINGSHIQLVQQHRMQQPTSKEDGGILHWWNRIVWRKPIKEVGWDKSWGFGGIDGEMIHWNNTANGNGKHEGKPGAVELNNRRQQQQRSLYRDEDSNEWMNAR